MSTAKLLLTAAAARRLKLSEHEEGTSWSSVEARKGHSRITKEVKLTLHGWVLDVDHPRVVNSPTANDTLLVLNEESGKKERVGKLLIEISVRELHNDLISPASDGGLAAARVDGKVIISDTALRYLLPPQLKPMTEKHKQMCGCEVCLVPDSPQRSLNARRARLKRELYAAAAALPAGPEKVKAQERATSYQPTLDHSPPYP
jgi:hypothetical protein